MEGHIKFGQYREKGTKAPDSRAIPEAVIVNVVNRGIGRTVRTSHSALWQQNPTVGQISNRDYNNLQDVFNFTLWMFIYSN